MAAETALATPPVLSYKVLRTLPHNTAHFTQGLIINDGRILESVGRYGQSALIEKEIESGRTLRARPNPATVFAEGLARVGDFFYQLTWKEHTAFVYDQRLQLIGNKHYAGEGWGLATLDGTPPQLVMSNGSAQLAVLDPSDFRTIRTITVHTGAHEIPLLNELETAQGRIYANLWMTDLIAVVSPADGSVLAWLNLTELKTRFPKPAGWDEREHVLNGIAYDAATDRFYVTGKCWPVLFELQIDRSALAGNGTAN